MLLHDAPRRQTPVQRARTIASRLASEGAVGVLVLLVACGGASEPAGPSESATLSGTVMAVAGSAVLDSVTIRVGTRQATSDANGHFELTGLPVGAATVLVDRPGYAEAQAAITLNAGANTRDFTLTVAEVYVSDSNAMYVPAGVGPMRAVIILLGGPFTKGFITGDHIAPAIFPDMEPSVQALGADLRALATSLHVALFGSETIDMPDESGTDGALFSSIGRFAGLSDHPELARAPLLLVGISAGGRETAGLASRYPDQAIGLFERVPTSVSALTSPAALAVPTFVMQAELDDVADNPTVRMVFSANRSRGGLWALAVEPGIGHGDASSAGNAALVDWVRMALSLRLPATPGDPLIALHETSGWLGNQTTLEIDPWASYPGDRTLASWLLSQSAATAWQGLGEPPGRPPPLSNIRPHR
ncbi:MAG: carboxypeptidase regulatory-like domain-containing protein [Gemmatimonadales bacterium]